MNEGPMSTGSPASPGPVSTRSPAPSQGPRIGPVPLTIPLVVVVLVLIGSLVFIGWIALGVRDDQISLLAVGFVAFGAACAAIAVGAVLGLWRSASRSEGGRAAALAIVGGLAGLSAIGSFTIAALLTMVLNT